VAAAFDAVAEEYDDHYANRADLADTHHVVNRARDLYASVAPGLFVDLGCGPGTCVPWLMLPPSQYLGIDISEKAIRVAQRKWPEYRFAVRDECSLERMNVDFIFGGFGPLQHAWSIGAFADSIRKSLRRGGRFLLMGRPRKVPTSVLGSDALTRAYRAAEVRSAFGGWAQLDIYAHRALTPRWLPYALQRTGLFWEEKLNLDPNSGEWLVVEGLRW